MRKIIDIMINDLRVFFREPGQIIGLVLIPLILTVGVGIGTGGLGGSGTTSVRVDVIDNDSSDYSQQFLANLRAANSTLALCPFDDSDNSCQLGDTPALDLARSTERLRDDQTEAIIQIPAGFGAKVESGEPVEIVYSADESLTGPSYILQAVQAAAGKMGSAQVAATVGLSVAESFEALQFKEDADREAYRQAVYDRASELLRQNLVTVDLTLTERQPEENQQIIGTQAGFGQSVPGMGSMFVLFTVFGALFTLIREKANWTLQRLVMMPVARGQILAGKILMWFVAGMIQFAVVFAIGLALRVNFGDQPLALLLVMVIFTLCVTALAFAVSTFLKTELQANSISLLLALTLAPLGGAWWPLDIVPGFMRVVGHISPVAWATDSFRSLIFENGTLLTVLPNIGVLAAITVVFFAVAVWRFRYE
jgi:ABC-2 type transport system permease protein